MRIVHVITRLFRAGSEENTIASCRAQAAAGHEVYLVHGKDFDRRWYEALKDEVKLIEIANMVHPLAPLQDLRAYRDLRRLFKALKPDIVHTHQSKAGIIGRLAARAAAVPGIVHGVHIVPFDNVSPAKRLVYLTAERIAARVTHQFIDVSRGMRDLCLAAGVGRPDNHHIIHSGFDLTRFRAALPPEDWREILGIAADAAKPPVVVMLAALEARKRHAAFISELPKLIARHPDVRVLMAGEGEEKPALESLIARLGLEQNVRLLGYRQDPERIAALADICTLTSSREGLPRVVMQYLATGKPCVSTALPGLDEVLRDAVNGRVLAADDIAGAVQVIGDLIADPQALAALSAGAAQTDLSSWEVQNMCRGIETIYQSMRG